MLLAISAIVMAASSENDEQLLASAESFQDDMQRDFIPNKQKDNTPIIIIGIVLLGLWYIKKQKNGGKQK